MRILVLNADYPRFLAWFYGRQPGLENASYAAQMAARNASLFGVADFYSRNFHKITVPSFVRETMPKEPLDGEFWWKLSFSSQH